MNSATKNDYDNLTGAYLKMYTEMGKPNDEDDDASNDAEYIAAAEEMKDEGGKVPQVIKQAANQSKKNIKKHIKNTR